MLAPTDASGKTRAKKRLSIPILPCCSNVRLACLCFTTYICCYSEVSSLCTHLCFARSLYSFRLLSSRPLNNDTVLGSDIPHASSRQSPLHIDTSKCICLYTRTFVKTTCVYISRFVEDTCTCIFGFSSKLHSCIIGLWTKLRVSTFGLLSKLRVSTFGLLSKLRVSTFELLSKLRVSAFGNLSKLRAYISGLLSKLRACVSGFFLKRFFSKAPYCACML